METPIVDFVNNYAESSFTRFHMPGHKGEKLLGYEKWDITEIAGADALYEAAGIIAKSEENATKLFQSGHTYFSTEGSSQCIRAMLYLAMQTKKKGEKPLIMSARNVHKAFLYAAALLDFEVEFLYPENTSSLCSCVITKELLKTALEQSEKLPVAIYITSPDYLGKVADIEGLAKIAHQFGTLLIVDNAHGAYLQFLPVSQHPLALGADMCCDSAHKTLPVLTGGAYLHLSEEMQRKIGHMAKYALGMFGSTSPSYLILSSLDLCNAYLEHYTSQLTAMISEIEKCKQRLKQNGIKVCESDPLRLTIKTDRIQYADLLRKRKIECEFADHDHIVFMMTPSNHMTDLQRLCDAIIEIRNMVEKRTNQRNELQTDLVGEAKDSLEYKVKNLSEQIVSIPKGKRRCSIREAVFSNNILVSVEDAVGKICASPTVSCPPAIPIAVSGEEITEEAVAVFRYYGIETVMVVDESQ